jgi:hypothetical protein
MMGFRVDPGPLPFVTVRDAAKWLPRLANGQIEISVEVGREVEGKMVRVVCALPITETAAHFAGLHVPASYAGRGLIAIFLDSLPSSQ